MEGGGGDGEARGGGLRAGSVGEVGRGGLGGADERGGAKKAVGTANIVKLIVMRLMLRI